MAEQIGITRDIGKVSTTTQRLPTIGMARDIARPETISAKTDLTKYVKLGDDTYVDKKAFQKLPEDVQKIGKLQGYSALQTRLKDKQNVISSLKPFTDKEGKINLVKMVESGSVDTAKLIDHKIFDQSTISKAEDYAKGMALLKGYISADGTVALVRAFRDGVNIRQLVNYGLYSQNDIDRVIDYVRRVDAAREAPKPQPTPEPEPPTVPDIPFSPWNPPFPEPTPTPTPGPEPPPVVSPFDPITGEYVGITYVPPMQVKPVTTTPVTTPVTPTTPSVVSPFDPITGEYIGITTVPSMVSTPEPVVAGGWKPGPERDTYASAPKEYIDAVIKSFVPSLENPLPPFAGRVADKEGNIYYDEKGNKITFSSQAELEAFITEKSIQASQKILDTQYVELPIGADGKKKYYPKEGLTPEQIDILRENGLEGLRQYYADQYIELSDGGIVPKIGLTLEEQTILKDKGEDELRKYFDENYIKSLDGQYYFKANFTPEQLDILKNQGGEALRQNIEQLNDKMTTYRTGYAELAEPMVADGLVLMPPVVSPDTIAQLPPTFDSHRLYDGLAKGDITENDIRSYFGDEAKVILEGKVFRDTLRDGIGKIANELGVTITDINNPTVAELQALIEKDPSIAIALNPTVTGYDASKLRDAITNIDLDKKVAFQKVNAYGDFGPEIWPEGTTEAEIAQAHVGSDKTSTQSLLTLAKFQRDNPDDTETLKKVYGQETYDKVQEYNKNVGTFVKDFDNLLAQRDTGFFGGKDVLTSEAQQQLQSTIRAYDQLGIKHGYQTEDKSVYVSPQKIWGQLDYDTKVKVADIMMKDPARQSWWGSLGADVDLMASENLVSGLLLGGIQPITHVIGKQVTLPEARELLSKAYESDLAATTEFKRDDGTIDIDRLKDKISVDDEFKKKLLSDTGYEKPEDLIANLEYYNNGQRVTNMEWATAGATAALDLLGLAAPMAGKFAQTAIGKALSFGIPVGSAAVFLPSSLETVFNPKATTAEKILAGSMPIILVAGGALGLRGKTPTLKEARTVDSVKATLGQSARPIDTALNDAVKDVSKAGTVTTTVANLKALPDVVVAKVSSGLDNIKTLADEVASGRLNERVRSGVRVAASDIKGGLVTLKDNVGKVYNESLARANVLRYEIKLLADKISSGELNAIAVARIKTLSTQLRNELNNIGQFVDRTYEKSIIGLNNALNKIDDAMNYVAYGRLEDDIRLKLSDGFDKLSKGFDDLSNKAAEGYEKTLKSFDDLNNNIDKFSQNIIDGKIESGIGGKLTDLKTKIEDMSHQQQKLYGEKYAQVLQTIKDKVETANKIIEDIKSGKATDKVKSEFKELIADLKNTLDKVKESIPNYYYKTLDRLSETISFIEKSSDKIANNIFDGETILHVDYLKRSLDNLKTDFNAELRIAELEQNIKARVGRIKQLFDANKISEDTALSELQSLQRSPEWVEHQNLTKSLATEFNNRLSEYYTYKISRLDMVLESIARKVALGDEIAGMKLPYDIKWAIFNGDDVDFNSKIEQLKLKAGQLPLELREATLAELNEAKTIGDEYIDTLKKTDVEPDSDGLNKQISLEENELNNAKRIREKVVSPDIRKELDRHIPELQKSIERKKTQLAERLKDPFKDVEWFKTVTKEESEAAKVAKVTKELAKREEVAKEKVVIPEKPKVEPSKPIEPSRIAEEFVLPSGEGVTPYRAIIFENGEFTYKVVTPTEIPSGKVYKLSDTEDDRFWELVQELEKSMTKEQALKFASEQFGKDIGEGKFEPFVTPKEEPKEVEDVYGIFGEEKPAPTVKPVPTVVEKPIEETKPEEAVKPELELKPATEVATSLEEPQKKQIGTLPTMSIEQQVDFDRISRQKGVIEWRMGKKWQVLPPPYRQEDMRYFDKPLPGTYKFATGKGSAYKTIQVIGGMPDKDVDVDLGWTNVHISSKGKELQMTFGGGSEAAKERWEQEQAQMDELSKRAYQELPSGQIVERIPKTRVTKERKVVGLNKVLLPEFSTNDLKVYSVNGEYIRNKYGDTSIGDRKGIDFVDGGHAKVYWNLIPEGEVWVEENISPSETGKIVLHEINELNDMSFNGKDYSEAHDLASEEEVKARTNPQIVKSVIEREQQEYSEKIPTIRKQPIRTYEERVVEEEPVADETPEDQIYIPAHYRTKKGMKQKMIQQQSNAYVPRTYLGRRIVGGLNIGI